MCSVRKVISLQCSVATAVTKWCGVVELSAERL